MAEAAGARRRTFGPVVLLGLGAGILAAVAGARPWAEGSSGRVDTDTATGGSLPAGMGTVTDQLGSAQEMPLAAALALVVLACWGVVLVTRGVVRRVVAVLGALAAAGLVVACVVGFSSVPDGLADALLTASGTDTVEVSLTGWFATACVGAVLSLAATVAAVAWTPAWPEMGQRYDAPAAGAGAGTGAAGVGDEAANLDLWKALDEGHDPTADLTSEGTPDDPAGHTGDTDGTRTS